MINSDWRKKTGCFEDPKVNIDEDSQKMRELKKRFDNLDLTIEKTKKEKQENINETIIKLTNTLEMIEDCSFYKKSSNILYNLKEKIDDNNKKTEEFEESISRKLKTIQEEFRISLDDARNSNIFLMKEFNKQSNDFLFNLGLILKKSNKSFNDELDQANIIFDDKLESFRNDIEQEKIDREESIENTEIKLMSELDKLNDDIIIEKKMKDETNLKIDNLIKNMKEELSKKVEREKIEREKSNNSLLQLLEEACNRIERNFSESFN